MLFIWYKFRHIKHSNTILCKHFSMKSLCALTLVDGIIKWRIMLNLCTSYCIGAPSVSQIVISYLYTWYYGYDASSNHNKKKCNSKYMSKYKMLTICFNVSEQTVKNSLQYWLYCMHIFLVGPCVLTQPCHIVFNE